MMRRRKGWIGAEMRLREETGCIRGEETHTRKEEEEEGEDRKHFLCVSGSSSASRRRREHTLKFHAMSRITSSLITIP